jgi:hypothetical protein
MAVDRGETALRLEARQFGAYLVGIEPPEELVHRYVQAMSALNLSVNDKDRRLLRFTSRHRWSIGFVDGALALTRPSSAIRKKLLVLSAILEATPRFADMFLPVPRRSIYGAYVIFTAVRAAFKAAIGIPLVIWI